MRYLKILIIILLPLCVTAQQTDSLFIREIHKEVMTHSTAYENLRQLCKKVGHRLSGSVQAERAIHLTKQMLIDAGADTVYLQPCLVTKWERGAPERASVRLKNGTSRSLNILALGNSAPTSKNGLTAPIVEVKSLAHLNELGNRVKGSIVFINQPMDPVLVETFLAYGHCGPTRSRTPGIAQKLGAVGVIVRSLASNIDDYPHTGVTFYNDSFPRIPAVAISTRDAEWLSNALSKGNIASCYIKTNCVIYDKPVLSYNVIGELRGSTYPNEFITVGGHLDSWDVGEGAHDDGTGCMQSIEVVRALKKLNYRPQRTIRAVLFMNEENGSGGSKAYFDSAVVRKENHIFALESDAGGFTPRGFGIDADSSLYAEMEEWKGHFVPYYGERWHKGGGGVDIAPLKKIGAVLAGYSPDSQRYFDVHHSRTDVFEAVSKRELDLGAVNITALIYLIDKYGVKLN